METRREKLQICKEMIIWRREAKQHRRHMDSYITRVAQVEELQSEQLDSEEEEENSRDIHVVGPPEVSRREASKVPRQQMSPYHQGIFPTEIY